MEVAQVSEQNERERLLEAILRDSPDDDVSALAGRLARDEHVVVITASDGELTHLAIAAQAQAGRSGLVWPPRILSEGAIAGALEAGSAVDLQIEIVQQAADWLTTCDSMLAQALLDPLDAVSRGVFLAVGFQHLADLAYLGAEQCEFPQEAPHRRLDFQPFDTATFADQQAHLAKLLQRTYVGTQDCPAIANYQTPENALASYQGVGQFDPANWFVVKHGAKTVGCLLLADQRSGAIPVLELIYMGVTPEARGAGFGAEIVRFAQWHAHNREAARLVLAVDSNNQPALAMYAECGFGLWGQKSAMVKKLGD